MAYGKPPKDNTRVVGSKKPRKALALDREQLEALALCIAYCATRRIAVYVSAPSTTNGTRVKFYAQDDNFQTYLSWDADWHEELPQALAEGLEEEIKPSEYRAAAPWLAERASEALRRADLARGTSGPAERPQRPAEKA